MIVLWEFPGDFNCLIIVLWKTPSENHRFWNASPPAVPSTATHLGASTAPSPPRLLYETRARRTEHSDTWGSRVHDKSRGVPIRVHTQSLWASIFIVSMPCYITVVFNGWWTNYCNTFTVGKLSETILASALAPPPPPSSMLGFLCKWLCDLCPNIELGGGGRANMDSSV